MQIDRALNNLGEIDILVNNAGLMKSSPLVNPIGRGDRRHSRDLWQRVMRVNLDGVFFSVALWLREWCVSGAKAL